jgi:hypothetical protein
MRIYGCFDIEDSSAEVTDRPVAAFDLRVKQPLLLYGCRHKSTGLLASQEQAKDICDEFDLEFFSDERLLWLAAPDEAAAAPALSQLRRLGLFSEHPPPLPSGLPPLVPPNPSSNLPPNKLPPNVAMANCPQCGRPSPGPGKLCANCLLAPVNDFEKKKEAPPWLWPVVGTAIGILLIALISYAAWNYFVNHPDPPLVNSFSIDPPTITQGKTATLKWSTSHADRVVIEPGLGQQNDSGELAVSPSSPTTYTLQATNKGGTVTKQISLGVWKSLAPPKANFSFTSDKSSITRGEHVELRWQFSSSESKWIRRKVTLSRTPDNGFGRVDASSRTSFSDTPEQPSTYRLMVTDVFGQTTWRTVAVEVRPAIERIIPAQPPPFRGLPPTPKPTQPVTPGREPYRGQTPTPVQPTRPFVPPTSAAPVLTLTVSPANPYPCQESVLTWSVRGAFTRAIITPDNFNVFREGRMTIHPIQTTDYTLRVEWAGGPPVSVTRELTVTTGAGACGEIVWTGLVPIDGTIAIDCLSVDHPTSEPLPSRPIQGCFQGSNVQVATSDRTVFVTAQPYTLRRPRVVLHSIRQGQATIHLRWGQRP